MEAETPPGSYTDIVPDFESPTPPAPPLLPAHLQKVRLPSRQALLNAVPQEEDPDLLPLPHHVMLLHTYMFPRPENGTMIYGTTERYRTKFVTTVYYKPMTAEQQEGYAEPPPTPLLSD